MKRDISKIDTILLRYTVDIMDVNDISAPVAITIDRVKTLKLFAGTTADRRRIMILTNSRTPNQ